MSNSLQVKLHLQASRTLHVVQFNVHFKLDQFNQPSFILHIFIKPSSILHIFIKSLWTNIILSKHIYH